MFVFRFICTIALSAVIRPMLASVTLSDKIEYVGRFDFATGSARSQWPGSGIKFQVQPNEEDSTATIQYANCIGNCKFFVAVEVNCAFYKKFEISAANSNIVVNLKSKVGEVQEITASKVTESANGDAVGIMEIGNILTTGSTLIAKNDDKYKLHVSEACAKPYNMLVIGDSITAGYGVEGSSAACKFSASTENVDLAYAAVVANNIGANVHILPWSGKGVVRNYGDVNQMSAEPMPLFYNRTIATLPISASNYWNPAQFAPDVVLVMLGTNDYSTQPNPSDEQFTGGLVSLLNTIRSDYPAAKIAAMCAPMRSGRQCQNIEAATKTVGDVTYVDISPDTLKGGYGCDYHPNTASQANMAQVVTAAVKGMLGTATTGNKHGGNGRLRGTLKAAAVRARRVTNE